MPSYQRSNAPYLYRSRHGLFYFRIVVPEAIRPIIGKREIRRSLRTTSKREAVIRSSGLMVNIQSAFERAYQGEKLDTTNSPIGNISIPTGSNDFPSYQHASNQPVSLTQATAPPDPTNPPQDLPAPLQGPYLSEINKEYRESQEREGVSLKTLDDKESVVRLLIRIVGDMPVSSFSLNHAKTFRETALKLPPLVFRLLKKNMSLESIIENADKTISVTTYNNYVKYLVTVFQFAIREEHIDRNPMLGMKIVQRRKANTYRAIFTNDELETIFKTVSVLREVQPHDYREKAKPFKYWLPYLGLYTGARLNELCQLYLEDVKTIDGIPCIHINESKPDQTLKTFQTERVIPIHSKLIELGFLEYVERQRANGHERLFPELVRHKKHGYSAAPSKWFGRLREQLDLKDGDQKRDFHSFRHSVADHLKQKGVTEALIGGILGHTTGGITINRYGKDFKPSVLKPVIEQIEL